MDIKILVKVTSRAWSLDILALLRAGVPGRQAALLSASGAGRAALAQSLAHLVEIGLLERNPGHGHPLRPEYRLTARGGEVAAVAERITAAVPENAARALLRRSWTVPVLAASRKPVFFSEIRATLMPITDRALSHSLLRLQEENWLVRRVDGSARPLRPLYEASHAGARISRAVGFVPAGRVDTACPDFSGSSRNF